MPDEAAAGAAPNMPPAEEAAPNIPADAGVAAPNMPPDAAPKPGADMPPKPAGEDENAAPKVLVPADAAPNIPELAAPIPIEAELNPIPNPGNPRPNPPKPPSGDLLFLMTRPP